MRLAEKGESGLVKYQMLMCPQTGDHFLKTAVDQDDVYAKWSLTMVQLRGGF